LAYRQVSLVFAAAVLSTAGCGTSTVAVSSAQPIPARPTEVRRQGTEAPATAEKKVAKSDANESLIIEEFLQRDSFCRDVLQSQPLTNFLTDTLTATKDQTQSRPAIRYAVYRESMFMYEFLDEELFAIRCVVPRTVESAAKWIEPYQKVFGAPTNTLMPQEFREAKASKFISWDLPQHNLRVNFAFLPPSTEGAELDLFSQFINLKRAKECLARRSQLVLPPGDAKKANSGKAISVAQREIEEQIADDKWGKVAATVNRLCAGQLSDEEIHIQILKTINLARMGHFSPEITLQLLKQAESSAAKQMLNSVFAVKVCQQSLAFGAAASK
jgi:hypothetical protein